MNHSMSRRTALGLAGIGALSLAGLRSFPAFAQSETSPYTFPNGKVLTWDTPWALGGANGAGFISGSTYLNLAIESRSTGLFVGYYDTSMGIEDAVNALLTTLWGDPALAPNVAGGDEQSVGAGGKVEAESSYRVHKFTTDDGKNWGLYFQLVNKTDFTIVVTLAENIAEDIASAQAAVAVDGAGLLADVKGEEIQADLGGAGGTPAETAGGPAAGGGTYTDASGNVTVTWIEGWTVVSQDDRGIELTNPAQSIVVSTQGIAFDGRTWQQAADDEVHHLGDDQGANATVSGPMVTDSGFSFATEGDYGLRLAQGAPTADPAMFVLVFAAHITVNGADAVTLLQEAQAAVLVNGNPPLKDLDHFIDMSAG